MGKVALGVAAVLAVALGFWMLKSSDPDLYAMDAAIHRSVLDKEPLVAEFLHVYTGAHCSYGWMGGDTSSCFADYEMYFYGRYTLSLRVPFRTKGQEVSKDGQATLHLGEPTAPIEGLPGIPYRDTVLTVEDWEKIKAAKGDISKALPGIKKTPAAGHIEMIPTH